MCCKDDYMSGGANMCRILELRKKAVVNISDGRRLGVVCDVDIDLETGQLDAIIIPGIGKFLGFIGKDNEIIIAWEKIKKIGEDIILVDMGDRFMRKYFD